MQGIAADFGYPPALDGKTLPQHTTYLSQNMEKLGWYQHESFIPTNYLHSAGRLWTLLGGGAQSAVILSYEPCKPVSQNNDWLDKMCPLI